MFKRIITQAVETIVVSALVIVFLPRVTKVLEMSYEKGYEKINNKRSKL